MRQFVRPAVFPLVAVITAACASGPRPIPAPAPVPTPVPTPTPVPVRGIARAPLPLANPKLPSVPEIDGPLGITVVYPKEGSTITSRDSNFIFGSVGNGAAGLRINGTLVPVWPNGAFMGWVPNPPASNPEYDMLAYTATDTARLVHRVRISPPRPPGAVRDTVEPIPTPQFALLHDDSLERAVSDTDQAIIGRPTPTGTYRWFLFPGTLVQITGYLGDMARVALNRQQQVWVARSVLRPQPAGFEPPPADQPALRINAAPQWVDVVIPMNAPPAYLVEEGDHRLTLTLYNVVGKPDVPRTTDRSLHAVTVARDGDGVAYTLTLTLTHPVYGYLAMYRNGAMTLRIRRPPVVRPGDPLHGRTIAIDPGHPPAGATGPTGLYEAVATLDVGLRVRDLLAARGAKVVMTRTDERPVALGDRPIMARHANAEALVSIHLNALPDGMNPFRSHGTGTYYFHPHSHEFASLMQASLVPQLGLRDLGTFRENLALVRPTWVPAVLTEGVFIIMPDQEAAMRTAQYQEAYARGIVNGLARFFETWR